jgi:hypothetical protein
MVRQQEAKEKLITGGHGSAFSRHLRLVPPTGYAYETTPNKAVIVGQVIAGKTKAPMSSHWNPPASGILRQGPLRFRLGRSGKWQRADGTLSRC